LEGIEGFFGNKPSVDMGEGQFGSKEEKMKVNNIGAVSTWRIILQMMSFSP
jgi:hypothetical protein